MERIVIVTKPSRLEELVLQHMTHGAARFVLESQGRSFEPYVREDDAYKAALAEIHRQIRSDVPVASLKREDVPHFLFRDQDLIIVCGPDGLFVNLAQYVGNQPIITVNPDPRTIAGVLMLFPPSAVGDMIARVRSDTHRCERLPFVKASLEGDKTLWGINDIFIGRKDQVSARYEVSFGGHSERQSSSGIVVATGVGATGWIRSIAAMVAGITGGNSGRLSSLPRAASSELVFVIREPFPSPDTGASLVTGRIVPGDPLTVTSEMPRGGCIFSDGVVEKAIEWRAGSRVTISVGDRHVQRVVA